MTPSLKSSLKQLENTEVFNCSGTLIEGWYWLLRSSELKKKKPLEVSFLGKDLVIYRGESGKAYALDAYCPHMGAHLSQGDVQGESIRCLFHHWEFSCSGSCLKIPAMKSSPETLFVPQIPSWPVEEKYGLIWLWTGKVPRHPLPYVPELKDEESDFLLGSQFQKNCHPHVVMINAIDAQHFNSVHPLVQKLAGNLYLEPKINHENNIEFKNITAVPQEGRLGQFIHRFYRKALTYDMSYWYSSTGSVTLGPDLLHFHIIFALRPTLDGKTEGQTLLVTKKRKGISGKWVNSLLLQATQVLGNYFAQGDTLIFSKIQFKLRTPIQADHAIIRFIQHTENQSVSQWTEKRKAVNTHENRIQSPAH